MDFKTTIFRAKICIILGRFLTDIIVRRSNQYRHAIEPNKKKAQGMKIVVRTNGKKEKD